MRGFSRPNAIRIALTQSTAAFSGTCTLFVNIAADLLCFLQANEKTRVFMF